MEEVIDISDLPSVKSRSTNFGGGLEFLMNDKMKSGGSKSGGGDIDLGDLNALEAELNELSDVQMPSSSASKSVFFSGIGSGSNNNVSFKEDPIDNSNHNGSNNGSNNGFNLGSSTASAADD
jgi:hypothetical protein